MTEITIPGWKTFLYSAVSKVVEERDGCIFKTEFLGYTHNKNLDKYPPPDFTISSISTNLTKHKTVTLELL